MSARVSGPENNLIQIMNLLNWSVPPPVVLVPLNVLLPLPAVVVVALPPVLVLGLFVVFLLPVLFFVPVVLFFFTANVEAVILPAVKSAIAVTMTKMANSVVFVCILGFCSARYYRCRLRRLVLYVYIYLRTTLSA